MVGAIVLLETWLSLTSLVQVVVFFARFGGGGVLCTFWWWWSLPSLVETVVGLASLQRWV